MVSDTQPHIEANWKISKVLETYPDLLETLANSSPAFAKLRNPLIRKVQSKLVTVEQAAGIAGLDVTAFLNRLNMAAGFDIEDAPVEIAKIEPEAVPDWVAGVKFAETLDVRPIIARGEEPFSMITGAARRIPVGEALKLRAPFDPIPLRDVLAAQGFEHYTTGSGDDWTVLYYRVREARGSKPAEPTAMPEDVEITAEVTIDVSELVPPEPMVKILTALEELPYGAQLKVHHVRRPIHLYPRLDEMGYPHTTEEIGPDRVEVVITKLEPAT